MFKYLILKLIFFDIIINEAKNNSRAARIYTKKYNNKSKRKKNVIKNKTTQIKRNHLLRLILS